MTDSPEVEIATLRARLARLEDIARQPRAGMADAIADHMNPTQPKDRMTRDLESVARGFVSDPATEAGIAARAKDPKAYDAEMRRVGVSNGLETALYLRGRDAAIKLGTFAPSTDDDAGDAP